MPRPSIQDLPVEVLLKLFHAVLGPQIGQRGGVDDLKRRQRPVLLTHICREWRIKALGEPGLWTDVQIHGVSEIFLSFLERSHPLLIDVTVRAGTHRSGSITAEALKNKLSTLAEAHIERIQSIWICGLSRRDTALVLSPLDRPGLHNLKSLHIWAYVLAYGYHSHVLGHDTTFLAHPTSVTSVALANTCPSCIPCQKSLTKLEILNFPQFFDAKDLQSIVDSSPALEILILGYAQNRMGFVSVFREEPPIISAPRLKSLAITSEAIFSRAPWISINKDLPCSPVCFCTFRNLIADNLEHLEVTGAGCGLALEHLIPFVDRRAGNTELQPLRLMINGVETLEKVSHLPRRLFLHLVPSSLGNPAAYSFLQEFLNAVIYFPASNYDAVAREVETFASFGGFYRSDSDPITLWTSKADEKVVAPLLNRQRLQSSLVPEDNCEYESYWAELHGDPVVNLFARLFGSN
ncbi:hypothetical protein NMY22_g8710 [Coprinellus aureogranulatus]|nr:hypothetical protein NMY22_g8710 [Coprinellus aureogranulatus]